jgi:hypothetical protein
MEGSKPIKYERENATAQELKMSKKLPIKDLFLILEGPVAYHKRHNVVPAWSIAAKRLKGLPLLQLVIFCTTDASQRAINSQIRLAEPL